MSLDPTDPRLIRLSLPGQAPGLTLEDLAIIGNSAPLPDGRPLSPAAVVAFQAGKKAATDAIVAAMLGLVP